MNQRHQKGASVTTIMFFLVFLGILIKLGLAVIPSYIGEYQLRKLVAKELADANDAKASKTQFLQSLNQQLFINANYNTKAEDVLKFTSNKTGALKVRLQYEEERVFFGDTYIVTRFDKEVSEADK